MGLKSAVKWIGKNPKKLLAGVGTVGILVARNVPLLSALVAGTQAFLEAKKEQKTKDETKVPVLPTEFEAK